MNYLARLDRRLCGIIHPNSRFGRLLEVASELVQEPVGQLALQFAVHVGQVLGRETL